MRRLIYRISLLFSALLILNSCADDYLDTTPTDAIDKDQAFSTIKNVWGALNGIHRAMFMQYDRMDQAGQGSMMINFDMLGEDLVMNSSGNGWFNSTYKWRNHRSESSSMTFYSYRFYYKLIANANMIIHNVDGVVGPEEEKKAIKGQALAYRGWAHFMLVQMFGERYVAGQNNKQLGVPLMTEVTIEPQKRALVEEVYEQINKDLDEAILNLDAGIGREYISHISVEVAKGVKARVALAMQDWETAATYANEARTGFDLMSEKEYLSGFNSVDNPEWMWGSEQISIQNNYFYSFFAFMSANFSSSNIKSNPKSINSTLYHQIADTDYRKQLWSETGQEDDFPIPPGGKRYPYINKKFLAENSGSSIGDIPYMRASEMYLIEAEAKAQLGLYGEAADLLYALAIQRDEKYVKSTKIGQELIDEIMLQRRIELWGEGFRFLDLKRTNSKLDRTGANHKESLSIVMEVAPGDKKWQFLIPRDELNANDSIAQNPL
ncbi:RagB/SusD family nutrient uptake outer membrane protein [Rapidithrix thailandica]|uniref:RagB/SusD family nutrient uptake outer membrane protein n=1 Tax=Rapidithrix thailandica TaxID=413964 RepID=A0AAW9S8Y7_9BACT